MPEGGTLIVAALLILAIVFSGYWIISYVTPGDNPLNTLPWFGAAAAAIIIIGLAIVIVRGRRGQS